LFAWARNLQRWHVVGIGSRLCFFEYTVRQLGGINSKAWRETIFGQKYHPLQDAFWNNMDLFNVMFPWDKPFSVLVFNPDVSMRTQNASPEPSR
jgi:hypothetical protein